ncbi:MAG: hypothetical protein AAF483_07815 [Planctomycetota bacterium]
MHATRLFLWFGIVLSAIPITLVQTRIWGADTIQSDIATEGFAIATFEIDVSPPIGSPLAYDPTKEITAPLLLKGIVFLPDGDKPIVLTSLDWLGVANLAQDEFKQALATAVETSTSRVAIHSIHQHDAPRCDLSAAAVLERYGLADRHYDSEFIRSCIQRASKAAKEALKDAVEIKAVSFGKAQVADVASNRRMLGPDGKVHTTRYTACRDPKIRALPLGVIDPWLRSLVLYQGEGSKQEAAAVLTFYATHPQSYYRTGQANPDFPGLARNARQKDSGTFHLHFNGAGGNIGAGKYNDGSHTNRQVLARKVEAAMKQSWEQQSRLSTIALAWATERIPIQLGEHLRKTDLEKILKDASEQPAVQLNAAKKIALLERSKEGKQIEIHCLQLGSTKVLFMPGELFVEYQLAAQSMLPASPIMMAAYGEYGTGYIGTRIAYPQGGYEVSNRASNVPPSYEAILLAAMKKLLEVPNSTVFASDFTDTIGPLP